MFGLARPAHRIKTDLRTATCALCDALSRHFGPLARLLVNYDLALLLLAAQEILAEQHGRCSLMFREGMDRAAKYLASLTIYYAEMHWRDKRADGRSLLALAILRLFSRKFRRARQLLGEAGLDPSLLDAQYARQLELERSPVDRPVDAFAEPTAAGAALVCRRLLAYVDAEADWLVDFGREFGAAIYWSDAALDYVKDARRGEFNALATAGLMARDGAAFALAAVERMKQAVRRAGGASRATLAGVVFDDMPQNIAWILKGLNPFSFFFDQRQLFRRGVRAFQARQVGVSFVAFVSSLWQSEFGVHYEDDWCCTCRNDTKEHCCSGWVDHHAGWCCNQHGNGCCEGCFIGSILNFVVFLIVVAGAAFGIMAVLGAIYDSKQAKTTKNILAAAVVGALVLSIALYFKWRAIVAALTLGFLLLEHRAAVLLNPLGLWALYGLLASVALYAPLQLARLGMRKLAVAVPCGLLIVAGLGLGLTPPQRIAVVPPAAPAVAPPIPAVPPLPPQPVVAVVLHPGDYYVRNAAGINVRATPSKAGTETGKLCYGSKVHVDRTAPSETDPGFVYAWVKTPKVQGWAFTGEQGDWFAPTQPIEAKKLPAGKTCRLNRDVNLRKQPNKDGQLVTKLAKSGSVKIENRVQSTSDPCGHFYRVRTPDGKSGYAYFGPTDDWVDCN